MTPEPDSPPAAADSAHKSSRVETEPRWPSLFALMTTWIRPALTTRRTRHLRLTDAWIAHLVAIVGAMLALLIIDGMMNRSYRMEVASLKDAVLVSLGGVLQDIQEYPEEALLAVAGIGAAIEGGLILFATLLMPWGARDEPAADSFRHALRRTWLHCGHVAVLILIAGTAIVEIEGYQSRWQQSAWQRVEKMEPEQPPVGATQAELVEYNRQVRELWNKVYNDRPFLVEYDEEAMTYVALLAGVWFLWALFRGLGADRPVRTPEHPPMCRACGYNLTGLPPDGRCPECGKLVAKSIGPDSTPGAAWERPTEADGGYLKTLLAWLRNPRSPTRKLRITPTRRRCPTFLLYSVILCGLGAGVGLAAILWLDEHGTHVHREVFTIALPVTGAIWAAFLLLFASSSAFVPGMIFLARDRRNLLSATFQAACYCSAWLFVWTAAGAATLAVTVLMFDDLIRPIGQSINVHPHTLAPMVNLAVHAICGIAFVVTVYRASAGVRYACR